MIEPQYPDRAGRAWCAILLSASSLLVLMLAGCARAWWEGRL